MPVGSPEPVYVRKLWLGAGVANLEEGVAELGSVAEAVELGAEGRALGAVFVAGDVSDVGFPPRRVRSALQALAVTAANGGWIFVTVKPRAGWKLSSRRSRRGSAPLRVTTRVRGHPRVTAAK